MQDNENVLSEPSLREYGVQLETKIRNRSARVGVIGLGYVGLSLAVSMARKGFRVRGIDLDAGRVNAVNAGVSYDLDVPSEVLLPLVAKGKIKATQALAAVAELDALSICVPTPLRKTKEPDISYIVAAIEAIRNHLRPGQLIVLESNAYPGTTRQLILPILEQTGLQVGEDFFLACSPERVDHGNRVLRSHTIPKVISGVTPRCTQLAALFYGGFINRIIAVSSPETAEMVKLLESTFRSVNVALANEMTLLSHRLGINIWEVIDAAQTTPFEFIAFYPGSGLGRHGIVSDPRCLSWNARLNGFRPRLIELAADINNQMPLFTIDRIADALNAKQKSLNGSKILVLGVTYKRNSDDLAESAAIEVVRGLRQKGASIHYSDPYVASTDIDGELLKSVPVTVEMVKSVDCVVLLTDHGAFDYAMIAAQSALIIDSRNGFRDFPGPNIIRL
jgi:UDP-N-acetyl-D-glucosamine dehydrogenase